MSRDMGLFSMFMSKNVKKETPRYEFSDEDRQHAREMRKRKQTMEEIRMDYELRIMESQLKLKDMEIRAKMLDYLPEGQEDDIGSELFQQILQPALGGMMNKISTPNPQQKKEQEVIPSREPLSDKEIRDMRDSLPKAARKYARTAPDAVLRNVILTQFPDLTDEEICRAIKIAKE